MCSTCRDPSRNVKLFLLWIVFNGAWSKYDQKRKSMTKLLAVCCIAVFAGFAIQTSAQEKQALRMVRTIPLIEPDANRLFYDPATNLIYFGYGGQNAGFDAYERVGILQPKPAAGYDRLVADMIAPTPRPGHLAEIAMDDNGLLLVCDSRADLIYQFDTRKGELIKSWPARGDRAGDMALDRIRHRLFLGTRIPPEMTVYDSQSGKEIQSLPGPETMDGVYYDTNLDSIYMTVGGWDVPPDASPCWIYLYR